MNRLSGGKQPSQSVSLPLDICATTQIASHAPGQVLPPQEAIGKDHNRAPSLFYSASVLSDRKWSKGESVCSRGEGVTGEVEAHTQSFSLEGLLLIKSRLCIPNTCMSPSCLCSFWLMWHEVREPEIWLKYRGCRAGCCVVTAHG